MALSESELLPDGVKNDRGLHRVSEELGQFRVQDAIGVTTHIENAMRKRKRILHPPKAARLDIVMIFESNSTNTSQNPLASSRQHVSLRALDVDLQQIHHRRTGQFDSGF